MKLWQKTFSAIAWMSLFARFIKKIDFYLEKLIMNIACKKKIKIILRSNSLNYQMSRSEIKKCKSFCKDNFYGYDDALWHRAYYGINGIWSLNYIPEHFFYNELTNYLNPNNVIMTYLDKNNYDRLFSDIKKPKTIIRKIDGEYYDENYKSCLIDNILVNCKYDKLIVKPTINTYGGKGIVQISCKDLINYLNHEKCLNLIAQERINQHKELASFNESSVNTIRISTIKIETKTLVCSAFLRVGRGNSIVDNISSGGLLIGINRNGTLKEHAFYKNDNYTKHKTHLDSKVEFAGIKIPSWNKLTKTVIYLHNSVPGLRFLSWDMAIDETCEPVFIEVNISGQDINTHQIANGPLFADMTANVLDWYKIQKNKSNPIVIQLR